MSAPTEPAVLPEAAGDLPASELRVWLRLLSCSNMISGEIRRRLRSRFGVTLPRFDLMAQLDREPDGLRLGELSQRMMVTNGNVTGLVDRLLSEGLISRQSSASDRRVAVVKLSERGRQAFAEMAIEHEAWLTELMQGIDQQTLSQLYRELGSLKGSVGQQTRVDGSS